MARWDIVCKEFKAVRDIINSDEPDTTEIIKKLIEICTRYEKRNWDFADDFERLREELEDIDADDLDDEIDYYFDEFYDLCDSARVFLDI